MPVTLPGPPSPLGPNELWTAWGGDPLVVLGLLAAGWCYARGTVRIWQQVGRGRVVTRWQAWAGTAGMLVLLVALASPLDALAGTLFSAHMGQHVLLTLVAAPLLAVSAPTVPLLQGLPHRLRRRAARLHGRARGVRRLTHRAGWPFAVAGLHAGVVWLWHLPGPYQAALRSDLVHAAEHLSLLGTGVLLWWVVLETGRRSPFGYGTGIWVVFFTALAHGGLSAVLTFAPSVLYPWYVAGAAAWGLTPIQDQHMAGVLMWAPGKLVHGTAVVLLAIAWLRAVETRTRARQQAWAHSDRFSPP